MKVRPYAIAENGILPLNARTTAALLHFVSTREWIAVVIAKRARKMNGIASDKPTEPRGEMGPRQ